MAGQIAEAYVQIIPTTDGIASGISKGLGGEGESGGKSFSGGFIKTATKIIAAAGIGKVIKSALDAGGELQQNLGGAEAVFSDYAGSIKQKAKSAYASMGMSASDYMATANKMGSLLQGSGMEQYKAYNLTTSAMQRAADVASVMGIDTTSAMEAIAGAAKGNFTMMDNLGVAMNATTLSAYALEKGMNFDWNTASNAEKTELAMQMFMDRTSQYAGNFARESTETFSGSMGAMKAAATNFLADLVLGNDISGSLSALTSSITAFAGNVLPMLVNILGAAPQAIVQLLAELGPLLLTEGGNALIELGTGLAEALPQLIATIAELIPQMVSAFLTLLPQLIPVALQIINALALGLVQAIPQLIAAIPPLITQLIQGIVSNVPLIVEAGIQLFMGLLQALPEITMALVEAAPDIVMALIQGLLSMAGALISGAVQLFKGIVQGVKQVGPEVINSAKQHVTNTINKIKGMGPQLLAAAKSFIEGLPEGIKSALGKVQSAAADLGKSVVNKVKGFVGDLISAGKNLITGLANGIKEGVTAAVNAAKEAGRSVVAAVKGFLGIHSPSTVFAEIGENITLGLAQGIVENTKPVTDAIDSVAAMTTTGMDSALSVNAALGVSSDAEATGDLRTLIAVVNALSRKIDNIGVYLDGDRMVGGLVDRMDNALGSRALLVGRGQA